MNHSNLSLHQATALIKKELKDIYPVNEIQSFVYIIFEHLLNYSKTDIHTNFDSILSLSTEKDMHCIINRLKEQEPIQYIIGKTEFYELDFIVNPNVLIPRQETEELVHWIIRDCKNQAPASILDMGTGSGCIAISLAKNLPETQVYAIDVSEKAIEIAKKNAVINKLSLDFAQSDIFNMPKPKIKYDIIVSNPPYVQESEKEMILTNVIDYEPHTALFVKDNNPLIYYDAIADFALQYLMPNGTLYLEINEFLHQDLIDLLTQKGFKNILPKKDLNGKFRMIRCEKN